jgi:hypothetical protein
MRWVCGWEWRPLKDRALWVRPARRLDLGLILPGVPSAGRLELSGSFNPLFTHRVRVTSADEIDAELTRWLRAAYANAG